jgi:hypothetical protein
MNKLYTTIAILLFSLSSQAAKLGPFNVDLQFCRDFDKWSSIVSVYSQNQLLNLPGGITTGLIQNTSVIVDFCQYLMAMNSLDTQGQISATLNYANKLSDNRFNKEIDLTRSIWDSANDLYDFNSGKGRKGALEKASTHRRLLRTIRKGTDYYDSKNPEDPIGMQTRRESEADMNRLSRLAYRRALLKEAGSCPKPRNDSDYGKIYEKEIQPQVERVEREEVYINFYRKALLSMGPKFLMKDEFNDYVNHVNQLSSQSATYRITVKTKKEESTKLEAVKTPDPEDATAPRTEEVQTKLDRKYQVFSTIRNSQVLSSFLKKYQKKWRDWVTSESVNTRGMARTENDGGFLSYNKRKVGDRFKDYSILCNRGKIAQGIPRNERNYSEKLRSEVEKCKNKTNQEISKIGGLLTFYAKDLAARVEMKKRFQGNIWTSESFYTGNFRSIGTVESRDENGTFVQDEIQCAPIKNLAAMQRLSMDQAAVNTELNQMLVEQAFKQNQIMERREEKERMEEAKRRRSLEYEKEIQRRNSVEYHKYISLPNDIQ